MPDPRPTNATEPPASSDALRERAERAEKERDALRRENERLRRDNQRLRDKLEAARRAGFRQAAPFSKNRPAEDPRRPGRTPGSGVRVSWKMVPAVTEV